MTPPKTYCGSHRIAVIASVFETNSIIDLLPYALRRGCSTTNIEFGKSAVPEEIQFESADEFRVGKSVDR